MGTENLRYLSKVSQLCHVPPPFCLGHAVPRQWKGVVMLCSASQGAESFRSLLPSSYLILTFESG